MMISIIIPTLNEESVLEQTLKHLRTIKTVPAEIIVSDGRSTDRTLEIARQFADQVVIYQGTVRQTIADARNLGAAAARGEILVFQDADVIIPRADDFLAKALKLFDENDGLAAVTVAQRVTPELATRTDRAIFSLVNLTHRFFNNVIKTGSASGEFQLIRKSAFEAVGGYNINLAVAEDNEMFHRLAKKFKTRMVSDLFIYHTGRRAHKLGWPKLLGQWFLNAIWVFVFKRSAHNEWKPIR